MRHQHGRRRPSGDAACRRRISRPTAAGCAPRAGPPPTCSTTPTGCSPRWSARSPGTAPALSRRPTGTRRWTWSPTASRPPQQRYGPDSVGVFGGGGLTNEKAYTLGKFARVALRTSAIDYNGRFCMSSAATAGNRAFGVDRGLPFPLVRHRRGRRRSCWSGPTRPTPCRRPCSTSTPGGRPGPRHIVVDPRRTSTARGREPAPGADPGHRPGAGQRPAAHRDPRRPDRRAVHRRAHDRVRGGQGRGVRLLAGPGGAHHRHRRRRAARRSCTRWRRRRPR